MTHHTTHFFFIGSKTGGGVQSEEAFLMLKQLKAVQIKGFTRYLHEKRFSASTVSFYFIQLVVLIFFNSFIRSTMRF